MLVASSLSLFGSVLSFDPGHILPELLAQVDCGLADWCLCCFRPESELIATTATLVTAVATHGYIYRKRSPVLGFGFV
jgi:hypothetical protein